MHASGDPALRPLLAAALGIVASEEPPELTHGFHAFPARFHPLLVRRLLAAQPAARRVLDPFCGSGTTLVEAALAGRAGFGFDVNPLAVMLTRLKATPVPPPWRLALERAGREVVRRAGELVRASRRRGAVSEPPTAATRYDDPRFYPPHVYRELVTLRQTIDDVGDEVGESAATASGGGFDPAWLRGALLLGLSSIVVKFSHQRSDTDERAVARSVARGAPTRLYGDRIADLAQRLGAFADAVPPGTPAPRVRQGDARQLRSLGSGSIDVVITSPPYLGTYDYAAHHARRFGWLGLDPRAMRAAEIGARREAERLGPEAALARWAEDIGRFVAEVARVLVAGGFAFVLIGDSAVGERALRGDEPLRRAAAAAGLVLSAAAWQPRPEPYRPARGQLPGGRREHLVALRKP